MPESLNRSKPDYRRARIERAIGSILHLHDVLEPLILHETNTVQPSSVRLSILGRHNPNILLNLDGVHFFPFFLSSSILSSFDRSTLEPYNLVRFVQNSPLSSRISSETTSQWSKQFGQIPYSACRLVMSAQQQSDTRMTIMFSISLSLFLSFFLFLFISVLYRGILKLQEKNQKNIVKRF